MTYDALAWLVGEANTVAWGPPGPGAYTVLVAGDPLACVATEVHESAHGAVVPLLHLVTDAVDEVLGDA